jgi:hypothetical protein
LGAGVGPLFSKLFGFPKDSPGKRALHSTRHLVTICLHDC